MKKLFLIFIITLSSQISSAQHNFGLGAKLSSIAGVNLKYWSSNISAFDCSVSWTVDSFWYSEINYLYHWQAILDNSVLFPYLAIGILGGRSIGDGTEIFRSNSGWFQGVNTKAGFSFPFKRFDTSFETGVRFLTYPVTKPGYESSFIFRYWF